MLIIVEVMDAHLQNNQTAEDNILSSPDRLKGIAHKYSQTQGVNWSSTVDAHSTCFDLWLNYVFPVDINTHTKQLYHII